MEKGYVARVPAQALRELCEGVFEKMGLSKVDARITADVLVAADLRGIDSHGVARLGFYLDGLRQGVIKPSSEWQVVSGSRAVTVLDACGGMGHPVSYRAMQKAIQKALDLDVGVVAVRNSNHYGIAGYYAMMALDHDCIGISMTNASVFVVPTHGLDALLGTNPFAVAVPAGVEGPFVLDMATSTVSFGKLEVCSRLGRSIPRGWAIDENGGPITEPEQVMANLSEGIGGGLLPLGGAGEELGGHKGYGLALLVDVLSGVLAGACCADLVNPRTADGERLPAGIGHFFGALRVGAFRDVDEFKSSMDDLERRLKKVRKAEGRHRVLIHGEREFAAAERRSRDGIPLDSMLLEELAEIAREFGLTFSA
ncbi:MAG: Ldh family oxidoreductase [bacterium]